MISCLKKPGLSCYSWNIGVDIDWEYLKDEEQANNFVALLEAVHSVSEEKQITNFSKTH